MTWKGGGYIITWILKKIQISNSETINQIQEQRVSC